MKQVKMPNYFIERRAMAVMPFLFPHFHVFPLKLLTLILITFRIKYLLKYEVSLSFQLCWLTFGGFFPPFGLVVLGSNRPSD